MADISALKPVLQLPRKVVITTHHNPDGDAVGSSLALMHYLKKGGHQVEVIVPNPYPDFLEWMPGHDQVLVYEQKQEQCNGLIAEADLIFCLDYNALKRINGMGEKVGESKADKVLIDHHREPDDFAKYDLHDARSSSTAELVYDFIHLMDGQDKLDENIGTCLYAGILTDTGSFQFSSTTAKVHRVVADLLDLGVDAFTVYDNIYNTAHKNRLQFFGFCWLERMQIWNDLQCGIIAISTPDQQRFWLKKGDTEGLVNTPMQIKGVRIGVLAKEHEDYIKLSFRSKGDIDVNTLAREHFNGGGHKNAAGGTFNGKLDDAVAAIKKAVTAMQKGKRN